jgi:TonB family protein
MFTEVVSSRASSGRNWYTIPLSLLVHAAIFAVLIVAPLLATGEMPIPARLMPSYMVADVVPAPPPAMPQRRQTQEVKAADTDVAPIEAPPTIGVESGIVADPESVLTGSVENLVEGFGVTGVLVEPPPPAVAPPLEPVRPGGVIRPPTRTKYVAPTYPFIAKMNKVQGIVIIEAIIGASGMVEEARVIRSTPLLDEAALEAVRAWQYMPTLLNGRPTPVIMTVTVQFKLN